MPELNRKHYVNLIHLSACVIVTCLLAMTVMLLCIVFSPHLPSFQVRSLIVSSMPINTTVQQTATFHLVGILENPNFLLSVWYKRLYLGLWFNNTFISYTSLEPPPHSKGFITNIPFQTKFSVSRSQFNNGVLEEIAAERHVHGSVNFGISLLAWIKFKFGLLGSKPRPFSLSCYPLQVLFFPEDNMNNQNDTGRLVAPSQCNAV